MRLTKSDPTGSYSYLADGVSPASDVLTDGHTSFTPGISEVNGLGSRFYLPDGQGNSRGLLDANQSAQDGYNWDAFGNSVSRFGSNPTGFAWNVSSGYQSDGDSGLKLLGHRYYDSRTGRFISQDPAGDGDNWYAYADNDPTDETDPTGLSSYFDPGMVGTPFDPSRVDYPGFNSGQPGVWDQYGSDGNGGWKYVLTVVHGGIWDQMNDPGNAHGTPGAMGGAMFAGRRGPDRPPIDPDNIGHKPQGTGNKEEIHTARRAGQRGNQKFGQRGYDSNPPGKREMARRAMKAAQEAEKQAARAERDVALRAEMRAAAAETATAAEELEAAEALVAIDEAAIAVGIIVK